jgi:hypothetical protein
VPKARHSRRFRHLRQGLLATDRKKGSVGVRKNLHLDRKPGRMENLTLIGIGSQLVVLRRVANSALESSPTLWRTAMFSPEVKDRISGKRRSAARLNASLDRGLVAYAAAASAAGVTLLALAQPAEGKIVYTKASAEIAPDKTLNLDLNHDGSDFSFSNHIKTETSGPFVDELKITPSGRNGVLNSAAALRSGVQVGPKGKFARNPQMMVQFSVFCTHTSVTHCYTHTDGAWQNITSGYLGLKFYIEGKAHYGWARLNVTVTDQGIYALLTGYAYESVANKAIITGKTKGPGGNHTSASSAVPGALGLLARGAHSAAVTEKSR